MVQREKAKRWSWRDVSIAWAPESHPPNSKTAEWTNVTGTQRIGQNIKRGSQWKWKWKWKATDFDCLMLADDWWIGQDIYNTRLNDVVTRKRWEKKGTHNRRGGKVFTRKAAREALDPSLGDSLKSSSDYTYCMVKSMHVNKVGRAVLFEFFESEAALTATVDWILNSARCEGSFLATWTSSWSIRSRRVHRLWVGECDPWESAWPCMIEE